MGNVAHDILEIYFRNTTVVVCCHNNESHIRRYDAYICLYNCINTYTPQVAATSFFAGEVEIFDFVTERAKRCIAANKENWG